MIRKKTVLVLGAGASAPYHFPTGRQLIDQICRLVPTYPVPGKGERLYDYPYHPSFELGALKAFQDALMIAKPPSIDAFLSSNPQYAEIGKPAIASVLIPCENIQTLLGVPTEQDWYLYLRDEMGTDKNEFLTSTDNIFIITFNYDRSLEYYFKMRLAAYHGERDGLDLVKRMNIVHVYGQLGQPDFLAQPNRTQRAYIPQLDHIQIDACVPEIKIISEYQDNSDEFQTARKWIATAQTLCFVGFGYDQNNIERLQIDRYFTGTKFLGSCMGFTANELNRVKLKFRGNIGKSPVRLADTIQFGLPSHGALDFLRNNDVFN